MKEPTITTSEWALTEEQLKSLGGKPITIEGGFEATPDSLRAKLDKSRGRDLEITVDITPRILRLLARLKIVPRRWATIDVMVEQAGITDESFDVVVTGQPRNEWRIKWHW